MKIPSFLFLPGLLTVSLLLLAGCDQSSKNGAVTENKPAPAAGAAAPATNTSPSVSINVATADPFGEMKQILNTVTLERREGLSDARDRLFRNVQANIDGWKTSGGTSTTAAEEKLSYARTDFEQKLQLLTSAGADTWPTAVDNAKVSLRNLQGSYATLLARK